MSTTSKFLAAVLAVFMVLIIGVAATRAHAEIVPGNFWKLIGNNLLPVKSTAKIGSSTVSGVFNNLTVSGTCTGCGGGSATGTIAIASGGTLTVTGSPISLGGGGTVDLNLANANTWTGAQTFSTPIAIASGGTNASSQTSTGVNYFDGTRITSGSSLTFNSYLLSVPYSGSTNTRGILIGLGDQNARIWENYARKSDDLFITTNYGQSNTNVDTFDTAGQGTTMIDMGLQAVNGSNGIAFGTGNGNALVPSARMVVTDAGRVGIGTVAPSTIFNVTSGASATTTVTVGTLSLTTSKSCVNMNRSDGGAGSFYMNAAGALVAEANYCK